jgi:arylsulfatase A-like enzyme
MDRRRFLALAGAAGLGPSAIAPALGAAQTRTTKPNIIFILADDFGYADLSCYGRPDIRTPNIDGLGTDGVRLLQAYANSAVCSASRTALMTGRYQYRLRVGLEEPISSQSIGLPPGFPTLPSRLQQAGYGTTLIGKWHLGALPNFDPLKSGYDHFYGFRGGALDYYAHSMQEKSDLWDDNVPVHTQGYLTDLLGDRAVKVVSDYAHASPPFFVSLHFNAPHWPWEAPGEAGMAESKRLNGKDLSAFDAGSQSVYRQMVEQMDTQVGRLLKALAATGQADNTIVIFTSDNGGERFADTWPFTGRKTELLEGGIRIPALVRWPARIPPRRTHDQVCIHMDWMPTLLAAAGTEPDPVYPSDGINLLPVLTQSQPATPRKLFWRYKANSQRAIRDGDLKLLKIQNHTFLFNVVEDPLERANLKNRQPADYQRLVNEWNNWNQQMLPELPETNSGGFTGTELADHFGAQSSGNEVDDIPFWPDAPLSR